MFLFRRLFVNVTCPFVSNFRPPFSYRCSRDSPNVLVHLTILYRSYAFRFACLSFCSKHIPCQCRPPTHFILSLLFFPGRKCQPSTFYFQWACRLSSDSPFGLCLLAKECLEIYLYFRRDLIGNTLSSLSGRRGLGIVPTLLFFVWHDCIATQIFFPFPPMSGSSADYCFPFTRLSNRCHPLKYLSTPRAVETSVL